MATNSKNKLQDYYARFGPKANEDKPAFLSNANLTPREKYSKMRTLYENNGAYDLVKRAAYDNGEWLEALKPLRTVTNRSVEFYVAKVLPDLKVVTENESVKEAIEQFMKWSNFKARKPVILRELARDGDVFIKVVGDEDKVYQESIDPFYITSFETDARGNLVSIRIDTPFETESGATRMRTEYWDATDKDMGYMAIWEHGMTEDTALDKLGSPVDYAFLAEMGTDFVPIIHVKFRDVGNKRGFACTEHVLDKIDEANREVTRLAQMLFRYNRAIWAVSSNMVDSTGKPVPAPKLSADAEDDLLNDNSIIRLPGMAKLDSLVPQINYADALAILKDMMNELEQDLPELKYYSLKESDLSGKAITLLLAGAVDRASEVRENVVQGLIRLNLMAMTIGKFWGLFPGLQGSYDAGSFEHDLQVDEMFSDDMSDRAATLQTLVTAGVPLKAAMQFVGFTEEEIETTAKEVEKRQKIADQVANQMTNNQPTGDET